MAILGKIFDKILNWQLIVFYNGKNIGNWKQQVNHWLSDYIHTKFGWGGLNSNGETYMQIGVGRSLFDR